METFKIIECKLDEMLKLSKNVKESNSEKIIFDFNSLDFLEPDGMLVFSNILEDLKKNNREYMFEPLSNRTDGISYATNNGFFQQMGVIDPVTPKRDKGMTYLSPRTKRLDSLLQEHRGSINEYWEELAREIFNITFKKETKVCENTEDLVVYSIREIFRNIRDHSKTEAFSYSVQFYPKMKKFIIAICDSGVGLKATIPFDIEEDFKGQKTDLNAIKKAVLPGLTAGSNFSYESSEYQNSGYGLPLVKSICEKTGGFLSVVTGNSAVAFSKQESSTECYLEGTLISMHIYTDKLNFMLEELVEQARSEAKLLGTNDNVSSASQTLSLKLKSRE